MPTATFFDDTGSKPLPERISRLERWAGKFQNKTDKRLTRIEIMLAVSIMLGVVKIGQDSGLFK